MDHAALGLLIFVTSYVLFIFLPQRRTWVAVAGAMLLVLLGVLSPLKAFGAVNWNVMGIFVGTLVIADLFMESRVPAYLAEIIVDRAKNTVWAILAICLMAGFISIFVENVATLLIVAPIALSMAKKLKISPVNLMIAIAISANLQGASTLIGDPPSMLLAGFARMNFGDFFFYHGKPSIFFAIQAGAAVSLGVLYFVFRTHRERVVLERTEKVLSWVPTWMLVILIVALAGSSFFDTGFSYAAGIICMLFAAVGLIWEELINKKSLWAGLKKLDWDTTFFLMAIFILVGAVIETGWLDKTSTFLAQAVGSNLFLGYTVIVVIAVIVSAFVDNVPFLAAMLPVGVAMGKSMGIDPSLFLFGLLIGASLGGNMSPIGASANIVACGLLKKEGYQIGFKEFCRIGIPYTIAAVGAGYIFIWIFWGH